MTRKVQTSTATTAAADRSAAAAYISCKGLLVKRHVLDRQTAFQKRMYSSEAAHLDILMPGLIQNGSYVFTHEINSQNCHSGAALFHHLHSPVGHDQAVADVDVGPALSSSGQHPLHFRVHVEVGNNANLLGRQHLYESIHVSTHIMHTHFANKPEHALQGNSSLKHEERVIFYTSTVVTWTSAST